MPLVRKRPSSAVDSEGSSHPPARRRRETSSAEEESVSEAEDGETSTQIQGEPTSRNQMVKKMVRFALACEYARLPIRRADVGVKGSSLPSSEKHGGKLELADEEQVLGEIGARQFKAVFDGAQAELRQKFGMMMVELPVKEKVTVTQRRAAQKQEKAPATSKAWVLRTTLPEAYRSNPAILTPSKAPTSATDSTYTALYTFLIALISLSGGTTPEAKLERYLKRTNADLYTPLDKTEKLLARMCKDGYLIRDKDTTGGEEVVEYRVGPRGKVEVGDEGVSGLARTVYGKVDVEAEELEKRLARSLGLAEQAKKAEKERVLRERQEAEEAKKKGRRRRRADEEDSGDEIERAREVESEEE